MASDTGFGGVSASGDVAAHDESRSAKRQRLEPNPSNAAKWSNAAAGHDPFSITQASPPRNKAREILAEVKKQQGPKNKASDSGWNGDDNFIAFGAGESIDFAPPPPQALTLSGSGNAGPGRGRHAARRGTAPGRGNFSHRDSLHATSRGSHAQVGPGRVVPPTARSFAAGNGSGNGYGDGSGNGSSSAFNPRGLSGALNSAPRFPAGDQGHALRQTSDKVQSSSTHEFSTVVAPAVATQTQSQSTSSKSKDEGKQSKKKKGKKQKRAEKLAQQDVNLAQQPDQPVPVLGSRSGRPGKRKIDAISRDHYLFAYTVSPRWLGDFVPWMLSWDEQSKEDGNLESPGRRLHKEIAEFYEWVRPRHHEEDMRHDVVSRLQTFMDREFGRGQASIRVFGSFATGLYLPDADIDVVALRSGAENNVHAPPLVPKNKLRRLAYALQDRRLPHRIAAGGSARAIPNAKVPIIKYVDRESGLNVDISFTNKNGLPAVQLCKTWLQEQPALAVLVALIKLYLAMREANEVVNGGLGGFSVTCLAYVFLYLRGRNHPDIDPMADLGATFISFLDFYSSEVDLVNVGMTVKPVTLFDKSVRPMLPNKGRLCILDPSDAHNDIAAGSVESLNILNSFAAIKDMLEQRIRELRDSPGRYQSILGVVYAGNYDSMEDTRDRLLSLADDENESAWP